jgi:hypothetical protein
LTRLRPGGSPPGRQPAGPRSGAGFPDAAPTGRGRSSPVATVDQPAQPPPPDRLPGRLLLQLAALDPQHPGQEWQRCYELVLASRGGLAAPSESTISLVPEYGPDLGVAEPRTLLFLWSAIADANGTGQRSDFVGGVC